MRAVRWLTGGDLGTVADAGMGIAAAGVTVVAAWGPPRLIGPSIVGPWWLRALLPLLMGVSLVLRRRAPLLTWIAMWAGIVLQHQVIDNPPRDQVLIVPLLVAAYSLGAHAGFRRAVAGLVVTVPFIAMAGSAGALAVSSPRSGKGAAILSVLEFLACWLAGVLVRARRRTVALQRDAERAAVAERARIARELHDIVAHHLAVVVLQAAGARASGKPAEAALEKIENSARQALGETRRMLGVLRDPAEEAVLAPQPGIGELDALADGVRAAGLPVSLVISGRPAALPEAVNVSVYRIVQEALTNVLKHAGPARAEVTIGCAADAVTIEVTDDGTGQAGHQATGGGHGLAGMRERAAVFGGELHAGPRAGGGFTVHARLPLAGGWSSGGLA